MRLERHAALPLQRLKQADHWPPQLYEHHVKLLGAVLGALGAALALKVMGVMASRIVDVAGENGYHAAGAVALDLPQ